MHARAGANVSPDGGKLGPLGRSALGWSGGCQSRRLLSPSNASSPLPLGGAGHPSPCSHCHVSETVSGKAGIGRHRPAALTLGVIRGDVPGVGTGQVTRPAATMSSGVCR
jgi:hypothetical protein